MVQYLALGALAALLSFPVAIIAYLIHFSEAPRKLATKINGRKKTLAKKKNGNGDLVFRL